MDPHLACGNINLWGNSLADPNGTYTIDGWEPSGTGAGDQAWSSNWSYDKGNGGNLVISVIDVHTLIAQARANGDAPVNKQGFHFKLQLVQDPQKHKTFWVDCPEPGVSGQNPASTPLAAAPAVSPAVGRLPNTGSGNGLGGGIAMLLLGAACCGLALPLWRRGRPA